MSDLAADRVVPVGVRLDGQRESADLGRLGWPADQLAAGMAQLVRRSGLATSDIDINGVEAPAHDIAAFVDWMAARLGVEAESVGATLNRLPAMLGTLSPGIVRLPSPMGDRFLLVIGRKGQRLQLLMPGGGTTMLPAERVVARLASRHGHGLDREVERLLAAAGIGDARHARLRNAMMLDRVGGTRIEGVWVLRLPPSASVLTQFRKLRLPMRLGGVMGLTLIGQALELLAWWAIASSLLSGRMDGGWLSAWALLLVTMAVLRGAGGWLTSGVAADFGRVLKTRLLHGALKSDADEIRSSGAGHLLARMMEAQAFEMLAAGGGLAAVAAVIEFAYALALLFASGAGPLPGVMLSGLGATGIVFGWRYLRQLSRWTGARLDMTHGLVERMVGHRTVLVQERADSRARLDGELAAYHAESTHLDRRALPVIGGLPAVWLAIGFAALLPGYASGSLGGETLAVAIGGVLFAARALSSLSETLASAARAAIAWAQIKPLFDAGARPDLAGPITSLPERRSGGEELLRVSDAHFGHASRPVLAGVDLTISAGDRLLLTGGSGSGKSTLASLLLGLRTPSSGKISMAGADPDMLGPRWHVQVAGAPQFHENHILTGSLAFNLLLGRRWPATEDDLSAAREICVELGLGYLLERMPAGLEQMVGETGWQLSHGEKSRIFLARALLQDAPLTILDESFAALDPETLRICLDCAFRRSRALLVIAHP